MKTTEEIKLETAPEIFCDIHVKVTQYPYQKEKGKANLEIIKNGKAYFGLPEAKLEYPLRIKLNEIDLTLVISRKL